MPTVREMMLRRLIRRVLIIPPAGLVGNWERELRNLFRLRFKIVDSSDVKPDFNIMVSFVKTRIQHFLS